MTGLRAIRIVVWVAVAVLLAAVAWLYVAGQRGDVPGITVSQIGGPFTLTDQNGNRVTEAALQDHPTALYFGYTYCPDVCPTTLADLTQWMGDLGVDADKLKVYFITVDPERDTQDVLASYMQAFDPRFTALTGTRPEIDQVIKEYRIYARKVPGEDGGYTMDHTASVFLLNAKAELVSTIDYQEETDKALAKLKRVIGAS
jgi:protein SCO1/2